jgi:hypothetical protein
MREKYNKVTKLKGGKKKCKESQKILFITEFVAILTVNYK